MSYLKWKGIGGFFLMCIMPFALLLKYSDSLPAGIFHTVLGVVAQVFIGGFLLLAAIFLMSRPTR